MASAAQQYDEASPDEIRAALFSIPADLSREAWVRIGMALKSGLGDAGDALWHDWSRQAPSYNERDAADVWKSTTAEGGIGVATLFQMAKAHGWTRDRNAPRVDPAEAERRRRERDTSAKLAEADKRQRRDDAAALARSTWDAASPADGHPYLVNKRVAAHGLRVGDFPFPPKDGQPRAPMRGALLIPVCDPAKGEIMSLQGITSAGGKYFLADGRKRGGFHMIGAPPAAGQPLAFGEGYATCAKVHELTGWPVVVCFDSGGLVPVSTTFRRKYASAPFLFCADNDQWTEGNPGMTEANKAAGATRGHVIAPEFHDTASKPTDWNDKAALDGDDVTRNQLLGLWNEIKTAGGELPQPVNDNSPAHDEDRRARQKDENGRLQDDAEPDSAEPEILTVEEMVEDCVWIADGSLVGRISSPRQVLGFADFRNATEASATWKTKEDSNRTRRTLHADEWKRDAGRKTVFTRTFHAGAGAICRDPDGQMALNTWRPIPRGPSRRDVTPFLEHVAYLFADPVERDPFLDWLAHIEQRPGVLPHSGWLHIAANTGTGRNWLASVLARVWRGYVAPNVDLPDLLDSPYNGALGGRILAIVDEVQEGGGENPYRHVNKLKSLVNVEFRGVNPKFGKQYREHNACRWLVFSNHENALPMNDTDRRWRVVSHKAAPRSPDDYARLYALLDDAEFINAVGTFLRERDISRFNPGERPPMNDAKRAAVSASKSLVQQDADLLVDRWPADVITNGDAASVLSDGRQDAITPAMRRALVEAGAAPYMDAKGNPRQFRVYGAVVKCWILRSLTRWARAETDEVATEARRARGGDSTLSALDVLAGSRGVAIPDDPPF